MPFTKCTFFIASVHAERGADASHRGGRPGFVEIRNHSTLAFPDYAGNQMFQTLGNIATRGKVQGGEQVMIGGFIVLGDNGATNVVVRAIGPSLSAVGVTGALDDPLLEIHDGNGLLISQNDDWRSGPDATFIQTYSLAPGDNRESAVLLQNPVQGNYTAVLKGKNGGIGVAIVEAYVF